jgi:tetratricopeptide (TPR) repeat protein
MDAVRKSPYTREAYAELGVTLREMKRYREAEAAFLAALNEREGYAAFVQRIPMHQNLAEIYLETGQAPKAINHLLWLSRYYRNDYKVQRDLGLAYLSIGRPDWAIIKFRQALLTSPKDPRLVEVFQRAIKTAESATVSIEDAELQKWVNLEIVNLDLAQARSALTWAHQE